MRILFYCLVASLIVPTSGMCQSSQNNRIEFYLLKSFKDNKDSSAESLRGEFLIIKDDLADTSFIKNEEILGYRKFNDTTNYEGETFIDVRHQMKVKPSVVDRINKLNIPLCCGRQFAITVNGEVIYGGYFWNLVSSFGCNTITAFASRDLIEIMRKLPDNDLTNQTNDSRENLALFNALKATGRLIK